MFVDIMQQRFTKVKIHRYILVHNKSLVENRRSESHVSTMRASETLPTCSCKLDFAYSTILYLLFPSVKTKLHA